MSFRSVAIVFALAAAAATSACSLGPKQDDPDRFANDSGDFGADSEIVGGSTDTGVGITSPTDGASDVGTLDNTGDADAANQDADASDAPDATTDDVIDAPTDSDATDSDAAD